MPKFVCFKDLLQATLLLQVEVYVIASMILSYLQMLAWCGLKASLDTFEQSQRCVLYAEHSNNFLGASLDSYRKCRKLAKIQDLQAKFRLLCLTLAFTGRYGHA